MYVSYVHDFYYSDKSCLRYICLQWHSHEIHFLISLKKYQETYWLQIQTAAMVSLK